MKFKEILLNLNNRDIITRLIELYPEQEENLNEYLSVLEELFNLEPKKTKFKLHLYSYFDTKENRMYYHVDGLLKDEYYAIEFADWAEWLGMEIEKETLKNYSELDIVCHSLWEMTFVGFKSEEITKARDILFADIKDLKIREEDDGIDIS